MLGRIRPVLIIIAFLCLFFEAFRLCMRWLHDHGDMRYEFLQYILRGAVVMTLLYTTYGSVFNVIVKTFIALALKAGGGVMTEASFLDPGQYIHLGFASGAPLWEKIRISTILTSDGAGVGYFIAWLLTILAYVFLAFTVFIAQVELSLACVCTALMLPFSLWAPTHWMAQGTIAYPINKAFRMFVLGVVACAMFPIIKNELSFAPDAPRTLWQILTTFNNKPHESWAQATCLILATWTMGLIYLKTSTIASAILSGKPALSGSSVMHGAIGTGLAAGTVAAGATAGLLIGAGNAGGVIGLTPVAKPLTLSQQTYGSALAKQGGAARSSGAARAASGVTQGLILGARHLSHD
jgi:type IV secretory pathway TrbL component